MNIFVLMQFLGWFSKDAVSIMTYVVDGGKSWHGAVESVVIVKEAGSLGGI
jgi:hypothetical protein